MPHLLMMRRHHHAGPAAARTTGKPPAAASPLLRRHRPRVPPTNALPEWFAKIVDFESWAPRSSRMWRLDQYSYERSTSSSDEEVEREAGIESLQARVEAMRRERAAGGGGGGGGGGGAGAAGGLGAAGSRLGAGARRPAGGGGGSALADRDVDDEDDADAAPPTPSAAASSAGAADAPLTAAAIARLAAEAAAASGDERDEEPPPPQQQGPSSSALDDTPALTPDEVRYLLLRKWDKQYDMAFVRRDLPGMRPFIALNVFPNSLEQRSFILTEEQYVEKLGAICARLHVLGQTARVRAFLEAPAKSQKGLPRRPTMGTAVSISLDVTPAQVEAYFTGPI
jgi:hypothetical protein